MQSIRTASRKGHIPEGSQGETLVLFSVKEGQGKVVPGDISNAIGISSARVATALNSLEEKGLITRRIDSDDRRKIIVELTQKGAEAVKEKKEKTIEMLKRVLMLLGEEDSKELVRLAGRLAEVLSDIPDDCSR